MEKKKIEYFKIKLVNEKQRVLDLLEQMERNEAINSSSEISSELSFYDNHPADLGSEVFDMERGMALKQNEITILKKIEDSLEDINNGNYGTCSRCRENIEEERLEFMPYTEYCADCQKEVESFNSVKKNDDRPVEEEVLGKPFGYGYNDFDEENHEVGFDAEDSYQSVDVFNKLPNIVEFYADGDDDEQGYVEPIEKISNEQYKNQLPD